LSAWHKARLSVDGRWLIYVTVRFKTNKHIVGCSFRPKYFLFVPAWISGLALLDSIHSFKSTGGGSHLVLGAFIQHCYHALTLALARLSFLSI